MFKLLRKFIAGLLMVAAAGVVFLYFRNPDHRRNMAQTTEELRERLKDEKKQPVWSGTVVVVDAVEGDKVIVNTESNQGVAARLAAIDAPEMPDKLKRNGQPLAQESRDFLARLVKDKAVQMSIVATDSAKRPLVLLTLGGTLINAEIVKVGLAEAGAEGTDALPSKVRHALENAELAARQQRTNIWGLADYVRPVEHRIRVQDAANMATRGNR